MTPAQNYVNDHARLLDKMVQTADAEAAKATVWLDKLATAKAEVGQAEERFAADLTPDLARELVEATDRVRKLSCVADAIVNSGGAQYARTRFLRSTLVFSSLAKGFTEKCATLEKLTPIGRKQLGARLAVLAEEGVNFPNSYADSSVRAWRSFVESIDNALANATRGKIYADARGVNQEPKSFDSLYAELTAPLPQAPIIPTPTP
jgi:hypothetical protein